MRENLEPDLDESLERSLSEAIATVGPTRYLETPLVSFDERCFPDPWEPSLVGVRNVLRRLMRHVRLPDVPVVVEDARKVHDIEGLLHEPVDFEGIEHGEARFTVRAIGSPQQMVAWLALEVVRAWAEYEGITRDDPLAYRTLAQDVPSLDEADPLDDTAATMFGVALGLGPLLAAGLLQTHHTHQKDAVFGGTGTMSLATQTVGGLPPRALARLAALHVISRGTLPAEIEVARAGLDGDLRPYFDRALAVQADDAVAIRERLGLPPRPSPARQALDLSPLTAGPEDEALALAECEFEERRRFYNRGRKVEAVLEGGKMRGMFLGALFSSSAMFVFGSGNSPVRAVALFFVGFMANDLWERINGRRRCSDARCEARLSPSDATCPACGGTIVKQLKSAWDRPDEDDDDDEGDDESDARSS